MRTKNDTTKNSVKYRALPRSKRLTVKLGKAKYNVPVDVKTIEGKGYVYLSIPASASVFKLDGKNLVPVDTSSAEAEAARAALLEASKPGRKTANSAKTASTVTMSPEVAKALQSIPTGYKIAYGADGAPRLVRTRSRKMATSGTGKVRTARTTKGK